jgi:hypothetical protein
MTPDSFKPTSLGLRMMRTAAAAACEHWHYSLAKEDDPRLDELETGAHEAAEAAGWAIIDAAYRNPRAHLGDLAVLLRCRHTLDGGFLDPTMYEPTMEEVALLYLVNTLLRLGGVDEKRCDQNAHYNAAKTSSVKRS